MLKIIWSTCSMTTWWHELHLNHLFCLSCNNWSCSTFQNCWKEWNALIRQRCYRESTCCQSTSQKGICGTVLTVQYLRSGEHKNSDHVQILQVINTCQVNNFHVTIHNMLSGGNQTDGNTRKISDPLPLKISARNVNVCFFSFGRKGMTMNWEGNVVM